MEQNEEKNGRVQAEFIDRTLPLELTAEFVLPDYRCEISRLLRVRPTFLPPTRFVGGGKAEFSGAVRYALLYIAPDGALCGAELEDSYAFSVPLDALSDYETAEGVELTAALTPDAVVGRVAAPRKLSVRCRMHARVRGYAVRDLAPVLTGDVPETVCRLCEPVENGRLFAGANETSELTEEVSVEGEGELRVIAANGTLFLPEACAVAGGVRCRGEAILTLLLCREGGEASAPFSVTRRVPFERELALDGVTPDCRARAFGCVGEIQTEVEGGRVALTAKLTLAAEAQTEEPAVVLRDLYAPGATADCRAQDVTLWRADCCGNRNISISGEVPLADMGVENDAVVLDAAAEAEVGEANLDGTRLTVAGTLHGHALCLRGGEYAVADFATPFRIVTEASGARADLACWVPICRAAVERDRLRVDAELQIALRTDRRVPVRVLTEARLAQAPAAPREDLEICYPAPGETLWNVGKRYGISPETLAASNGIPADAPGAPDSLLGVKFLMIP